MRDVRIVALGEQVDIFTGFPFTSRNYADAGIRLLRGDNVAQGRLRWDGAKYWPSELLAGVEQFELAVGDVVLAMDRPWIEAGLKYAPVRSSDLPCLLVQRVARLRARDGLDQSFLRFLIGSAAFTNHVLALQTGTAVPHISGQQIREFTFRLPPLREQRAIAEVLGALDDKIELNERTSIRCRELADAVWKRRTRAASRRATTIGELVEAGSVVFSDGYRTKQTELAPEGVPVLRVAEVANGRVTPTFKDHVAETFRAKLARKTSRAEDVVVTTKGTVGRVAMIPSSAPEFVYSPQLCFFRTRNDALDPYWLYGWFRSSEFRDWAGGVQNQTDMAPYINLDDFRRMPITMPEALAQQEAAAALKPLEQMAQSAVHESEMLGQLRDALLPALISGQLRVREVESAPGDAV